MSPSYDSGAWALVSRRLSRFLDPAVGLVAAGLAVTSLLTNDMSSLDPRLEPPNTLAVIATSAAGLSLVWRRRSPRLAFTVFVAGSLLVSLSDHYIGVLSVLLLFSLYSLAAHGYRRDGLAGLVLAIASFAALAILKVPDLRTSDLLEAVALLVAAWAVGDAIRSRRTQQRQRLEVAEHEAATARAEASRAVTEERLRLARELHDVVAHSMSLIAVQAGVGGHVIRTDLDAAEHALDIIAETSRRALTQTRSMLGLLRVESSTAPEPPVSTIRDLDSLIKELREAGIDVVLEVRGTPRHFNADLELAAYRMVQEPLTNILKHSSATTAQVTITYAVDSLDVQVVNHGGGSRSVLTEVTPASGHGLIGLRERARLVGGTLEYHALPGAGFRVLAHLPVTCLPVTP